MNRRKVTLLMCLILLIALPTIPYAQVPNGYSWDQLNRGEKRIMASWFLYGYDMGYIVGRNWEGQAGKEGSTTLKYESADFYWKQIDSFYQTFPLCKGRDLIVTLAQLAEVWRGRSSYKEVGDACLKSPN